MDPLWPLPVEVIAVTGEHASGKTLFMLTISPRTRYYDFEKSGSVYASQMPSIDRVDVDVECPVQNPSPVDLFNWWYKDVLSLAEGRYDVIAIDPINTLELGIMDYVRQNPGKFGKSAAQYARMQGLFWGDVAQFQKAVLLKVASRCQTLVFSTHMRNVWKGNETVPGKREPKGKSVISELATLYLQFSRRPDASGAVPGPPTAKTLKDRLCVIRPSPEGIKTYAVLPPVVASCTPERIRDYMESPVGMRDLRDDERASPDAPLTPDEVLLTQAEISANQRAAAEAEYATAEARRNTSENLRARAEAERDSVPARVASEARAQTEPSDEEEDAPAALAPVEPTSVPPAGGREDPLDEVRQACLDLKFKLRLSENSWALALAKRGIAQLDDAGEPALRDLYDALAAKAGIPF